MTDQRPAPDDEERWERIRRHLALLGMPLAPFVSPRDRERWRRDRRMLWRQCTRSWREATRSQRSAMACLLLVGTVAAGVQIALFETGRDHLAALLLLGSMGLGALWTPFAVWLVRRAARRRNDP